MSKTKGRIKIRQWKKEDLPELVRIHHAIYTDHKEEDLYDARVFEHQLRQFAEGQVLAELDGKIVGYACSIIVQLDDAADYYTYSEVTGAGTFTTHNPSGDTLYGADIGVLPEYRGRGIAGRLYDARKKLMKRYNLKRMVAHGRIPGYRAYSGRLTPEEYVDGVIDGRIEDYALKTHLKAGYKVRRIILEFNSDYASMDYATWLEMPNPDYDENMRRISASPLKRPVRRIRVCAAQYQMKRLRSWEEFVESVEFFVDTASTYYCHFLLLPELFTAQLFSLFDPSLEEREAIRELANMTEDYTELLRGKAREYGMHIIGGSHPIDRGGELYNVAHLFTPGGNVYQQDKLHITPAEKTYWNIRAGDKIRVFDTPLCRMAVLICYDIEFPELSRLLTLAGVEVLFVPFSTDERKAYNRVRHCAQARAIENYIYVVIAGNVGNLPNVKSYLINYGQSAILTPSDFAFPVNCIEGEADPNAETVVVAELDINNLHLQREIGSVRPLFDRRQDLYNLFPRDRIETIRTD